ncbi:MAG: prepilin peptidase [Hungatella sp.]
MKNIWFVFLCLTAGLDLKNKQIPVWIFYLFEAVGAVAVLAQIGSMKRSELLGHAIGISMGLALLWLNRISNHEIGEGDGWFFLVSGLYLTWQENLSLLCYGLLLSSIYSLALVLWGRWKGCSVRKWTIPFLPFVWPVGIWVMSL